MRRGGATEPLLDAVDGRVEAEATKQAMVLVRQRCLLLLPLQLLGCSAVWWVVHFVWICSSSSSYRSAVIDPLRGRQQHGVAAQGILASSSRRPPFRCAAEEEQVLQLPLLAAATLHRGGGRTRGLAQAVFLLSSSPWREGLRPSPGLGRSSREGRKESPLSLSLLKAVSMVTTGAADDEQRDRRGGSIRGRIIPSSKSSSAVARAGVGFSPSDRPPKQKAKSDASAG